MTLSWADRRLGAVEHEVLPVSAAGTVQATERALDLHAVRPPDSAGPSAADAPAVSRWIDPCTGRVWGSPSSHQLQDLALEAARDEQAARATRLTREQAWAFRRTAPRADEWAP